MPPLSKKKQQKKYNQAKKADEDAQKCQMKAHRKAVAISQQETGDEQSSIMSGAIRQVEKERGEPLHPLTVHLLMNMERKAMMTEEEKVIEALQQICRGLKFPIEYDDKDFFVTPIQIKDRLDAYQPRSGFSHFMALGMMASARGDDACAERMINRSILALGDELGRDEKAEKRKGVTEFFKELIIYADNLRKNFEEIPNSPRRSMKKMVDRMFDLYKKYDCKIHLSTVQSLIELEMIQATIKNRTGFWFEMAELKAFYQYHPYYNMKSSDLVDLICNATKEHKTGALVNILETNSKTVQCIMFSGC